MMRIAYIDPVGKEHALESLLDGVSKYAKEATVLTYLTLESGDVSLENFEDEIKAVKAMDKLIMATDYDAYIIGCFYDPGLAKLKKKHQTIITGPFEATSHLSFMLDDQATIFIGHENHLKRISHQVTECVFENKRFNNRLLGMTVEDMLTHHIERESRMIELSKRCGDTIIPGCTIESGGFEKLQTLLEKRIIDPIVASVKYAEFLYELKQTCNW